MNYGDPRLQDRLAADYVSGLMRGGARRRFEALAAADARLRRQLREWEDALYPLAWSLPSQRPPRRVWHAIHARVHRRIAARSWGWHGLYSWRLVSGALAAVLLAGIVLYPMQVHRAARAELMAVLQSPQAQAMLVVRADADGTLRLRTLQDLAPVAGGRALELWVVPPGQKPRSLGLVAASGATALRLANGVTQVDQLAVSLEPPGGSPTGQPTGTIVMSGNLLEI